MLTTTRLKRNTKMLYQNKEVEVERHREDGRVNIRIDGGYKVVAYSDLEKIVKPRAGINKQAEKRAEENKEYLKLRKPFLAAHPRCEINVPGCTVKATEVHHAAGRIGKKLIAVETFVPACSSCHRWAETNPVAAKEMGVSVNRL